MTGLRKIVTSIAAAGALTAGLTASAVPAHAAEPCPTPVQWQAEQDRLTGMWFFYDTAHLVRMTDTRCHYEVPLFLVNDETGETTYEGIVNRVTYRSDLDL